MFEHAPCIIRNETLAGMRRVGAVRHFWALGDHRGAQRHHEVVVTSSEVLLRSDDTRARVPEVWPGHEYHL